MKPKKKVPKRGGYFRTGNRTLDNLRYGLALLRMYGDQMTPEQYERTAQGCLRRAKKLGLDS